MVLYAANPDDPQLVGGRRYGEIACDFALWFNRAWETPPQGLNHDDVFNLGCQGHIWMALAKHAEPGGLRPETMLTASCVSVMLMANLPREEWERAPGWQVWGDYLDWYLRHLAGEPIRGDAHNAAIRAEYDHLTGVVLRGVLWFGDIARAYAGAAALHARGGWRDMMRTARRTGITSGFKGAEEDEVLLSLESMRVTHRSPLARRPDGQIMPNFGSALDQLKRERPTTNIVTDKDAAAATAGSEAYALLEDQRIYREFAKFERFLRNFQARKCRSEYAQFMTAYAWELITGRRNPESLAKEFGKSPRVMRKEWVRHLDRLERDPAWGQAIRRFRGSR
jgi:hypothetical protein